MNMDTLAKIGMVMQATGMGLKGQDGSAVYRMHQQEQEKAKRKADIEGLLQSMQLSQQKRDFLSMLPFEQQAPAIWELMNPAPVEGKVMGDRLVNPYTGEAIADYSPKPLDLSGIFGSDEGQAIKAGLMQRGLPEHVADAFVVNMYDESGLNPAINERNPIVPGSRGGFGLAQWTGPRRRQLEAFAAQQGTSPDDMNTQMDFLVAELNSTESDAARSILSSPDRASAAQAIVKDFLRPAPQNMDARSRKYADLDRQIGKLTKILASGQGTPAQRQALEFRRERLMNEQQQYAPQESPIAALEARAQAAGLQPGTAEYRNFMLTNGRNDGLVIESDGQGGFRMAQGAAAGTQKPFTEMQSKDNVFVTRATGALEVLEPISDALTSRAGRAAEMDPTGLARELQTPEFQVAKQAGDEFLQAILRKDTGAAITEPEQYLYGKTYLPQPGDGPEVLQAKSEARKRAVAAIQSGMSPAQMIAVEKALGQVDVPEKKEQPKEEKKASVDYSGMTMDGLLQNVPTTEEDAAEWNKRWEALQE